MSRLDGLAAQRAAIRWPVPWSTRGVTLRSGDGVSVPSQGPIATTYEDEALAEGIVAVVNAHDQLAAIARAAADVEPWGWGGDAPPGAVAAFNDLRAALAAFEAGDPT